MSNVRSINTILGKSPQMPSHTDLRRVFAAFGERVREYNWLFTGNQYFFESGRPWWIEGDELLRRMEEESFQFGWVVVSGFRRGVEVDLDADSFPWADGNSMFWGPSPAPQHPLASVEVVGFDSSMTLVLSREPEFARRFRAAFTDAVDLDESNRPRLEARAVAVERLKMFRVGDEVVVPVVRVGQTTGDVEIIPDVRAKLQVKQMRAAGFGPVHWFSLSEYLKVGQRVRVRITAIDLGGSWVRVEVEFVEVVS